MCNSNPFRWMTDVNNPTSTHPYPLHTGPVTYARMSTATRLQAANEKLRRLDIF